MSSEGSETLSTLSKIRQFGLYRTVDARTEEFLRLSKKRQIRQGCACAAISTAITVCIVVVILLIYEYLSTYYATEESQSSIKYFQIIMNNTMRSKPNNEISSNEKFGLDRRTLNILQILLNSLKHNELLDNIINESYVTTTRVTTDKIANKEYSTNVKTTTNKQFDTLELNHIPIYLLNNFKNKNINSSRFARKIEKNKEQKRLLDYFYKMINGRFDNTYPRKDDDNLYKKNDHKINDIFTLYNKNKTHPTTTEKQIKTICICPKLIQFILKNFTSQLMDVMTSYKTDRKETESQREKNNFTNTFWNNISSVYNKVPNTVQNNSNNNSETKEILTRTHLPTLEITSQISFRGNSYKPNYLSNHETISNTTKFNISTKDLDLSNFVNSEFKNAKIKLSNTSFINILPGNILGNVSTVNSVKINFDLYNAKRKVNSAKKYSLEKKTNDIANFKNTSLKVQSFLLNTGINGAKENIDNFTSKSSTLGKSIPNNPTNLEARRNNTETISNNRNHFNKPLLASKYNKKIILTYHNEIENISQLDRDKNNSRGEINIYRSSEENIDNYNTFINSFKNINSLGQILYLKDEVINKYYTTESPFTGKLQNNFYFNFFNNLIKMNNTSAEVDMIDNEEINLKSSSANQQERIDENKSKPSYDFRDIMQINNQNNPTKIKLDVYNTTKVNYSIEDYLMINNDKNYKPKLMQIKDVISSTQRPTIFELSDMLVADDVNVDFEDYLRINNEKINKLKSTDTKIPTNLLVPNDVNIEITDKDITPNDIVKITQTNHGIDDKNEDFIDVDEWITESYDDILSLIFSNYDYIDVSEESITKSSVNQIPLANINRIINETNKFHSIVNNSINTLYSHYKQVPITKINQIKNETRKVDGIVNNTSNYLYSHYNQLPITNINQITNETKKFYSTLNNNSTNSLYSPSRLQFVKNVSISPFLLENKKSNLSYANISQTIKEHTNIVNVTKYANNNNSTNTTEKVNVHFKNKPIEKDNFFSTLKNFINYEKFSYNDIVSTTSKSPTIPIKIQIESSISSELILNQTEAPLKSSLSESSEAVYNNKESFEQLSPNNNKVKFSKKDTMNDILFKKPSFLIIKRNDWWNDNDISNSNYANYYR